jgi:hypothetical protein
MADEKPSALIDNWWSVMWRAWSMRVAALGLVLPEVLQFIADNTDMLTSLDAGYKSIIRMVALVLVILLRPLRQQSLSNPPSSN